MGIDYHGLRLLQYGAMKAPFGATATIGRQNIHISDSALQNALRLSVNKRYGPFCEELLIENFGASSVQSFDASDYEKASILHDFNSPIVHEDRYDTVIDLGTLEHIFDVAVALKNMAAICRTGGRIIHALPANNYNGHGFWQFSPELFFSLYSPSNGFSETEVFIAELVDEQHWWKADIPKNGMRVEYTSPYRSYILVLTRKLGVETRQNVQQSDYMMNWESGRSPVGISPRGLRSWLNATLKRCPMLWRFANVIFPPLNTHSDAHMHRLSAANPHFIKLPIADLVPAD